MVGSNDGFFYCLNHNGTLAWRESLLDPVWSSGTVVHGTKDGDIVAVGTQGGSVYALKL